jgi:hypothetical protein
LPGEESVWPVNGIPASLMMPLCTSAVHAGKFARLAALHGAAQCRQHSAVDASGTGMAWRGERDMDDS